MTDFYYTGKSFKLEHVICGNCGGFRTQFHWYSTRGIVICIYISLILFQNAPRPRPDTLKRKHTDSCLDERPAKRTLTAQDVPLEFENENPRIPVS